ncbi:MAG: putative Na+/H+ antiporter [Bdellovibrionota bacterium]
MVPAFIIPHAIETLATVIFALAVLHTFAASSLHRIGSRFEEGSLGENFFHILGEVEVVFGIWAGILILAMGFLTDGSVATHYAESLNFAEALFVFAIMVVAATRPILNFVRSLILGVAEVLPFRREIAVYATTLIIGPLLGSFITEPAAMTVTALLLKDLYFSRVSNPKFQYLTLAVLFVNVSIGGVLTHFAAPPVLMVAAKWGWDTPFMMAHFGWKAGIAVVFNSVAATFFLRKILKEKPLIKEKNISFHSPWPMILIHLAFLALIVVNAHHPVFFIGLLLFFLGVATVTREYQDELQVRSALLVAFFLGGLVVLGGLQSWWIDPLLRKLDAMPLFFGATALTAITDNAALTYLGSRVEGITDLFKYALVSGAVAGGGLTVIANAPNPIGYSVLQPYFGKDGIRPATLLVYALLPTVVAIICLWFI